MQATPLVALCACLSNIMRLSKQLANARLISIIHSTLFVLRSLFMVQKLFINLHTLHLGSNLLRRFTQEHVVNMSKLQNLSLDNNSLSEISEELLAPLKRLRYLDMSRNYLEEIPKLAFKASCYLSVLIINDNKIRTPHSEWFQHFAANKDDLEQLVNLTGNPWHCDCSVVEYQTFLDDLRLDRDTTSLMEMLEITCSSPKYAADSILDDDLVYEIHYRSKCPPPTTEPTPTTPCVDSKCNYTTPFTPVLFVPSEINHADSKQLEMPNFGLSAMTSTVSSSEEITESGGSPLTPIFVSIPIVVAICVVLFIYYQRKKRRDGGKSRADSGNGKRKRTTSTTRLLSSSSRSEFEMNQETTKQKRRDPISNDDEDDVFVAEKTKTPETKEEESLINLNTQDDANPEQFRFVPRDVGDGRSVGGTPNMRRDATEPKALHTGNIHATEEV